jgi:Mn-dependent DtxR family transcriptional regulator
MMTCLFSLQVKNKHDYHEFIIEIITVANTTDISDLLKITPGILKQVLEALFIGH